MYLLAIPCLLMLVYFGIMYLYWGRGCLRLYEQNHTGADLTEYQPPAIVLLPLRGNDPFLIHCLEGLLNQEYPEYSVKIIVDHVEDPVFQFVNEYLEQHSHPHCQVSVLESRSENCGLKNQSLLQGLSDLSEDVEVVAWLDADVVPHRTWLRDLVQPLQNEQVGVASGIRWYAPREANVGILVRYIWNSAAVIQMLAMEIVWGGSVAVSGRVFRNPRLAEAWSKMMWEDTYLNTLAGQLDQKVVFVPAVTMVNEESTSLKSCFQFMTRQLMNARFYHSRWLFICGLGLFSAVAELTLIAQLGLFLNQGNLPWVGMILGVIAFTSGSVGYVVYRLDLQIRRLIAKRGVNVERLPLTAVFVLIPTLLVYCAALLAARRTESIRWRGVIYNAAAPFQIQIVHYEPYQPAKKSVEQTEQTNSSII